MYLCAGRVTGIRDTPFDSRKYFHLFGFALPFSLKGSMVSWKRFAQADASPPVTIPCVSLHGLWALVQEPEARVTRPRAWEASPAPTTSARPCCPTQKLVNQGTPLSLPSVATGSHPFKGRDSNMTSARGHHQGGLAGRLGAWQGKDISGGARAQDGWGHTADVLLVEDVAKILRWG